MLNYQRVPCNSWRFFTAEHWGFLPTEIHAKFWDIQVLSTWNFEVLGHQLTVSDIKTLDMCPRALVTLWVTFWASAMTWGSCFMLLKNHLHSGNSTDMSFI